MKSELKAKFLQHLVNKKGEQGFTLIELLVVIIIIGILSAIALPSFLNQANKAKQSEAKTYVGSMNRAQQAYLLEKNVFVTASSDLGQLGLGIKTDTTNYSYDVAKKDAGTNLGVANLGVVKAVNAPLKAYAGVTVVGKVATTSEATTLAVLCEAAQAISSGGDNATAASVTNTAGEPDCTATKFVNLGK
jgi:type IV pilus assembly protein PilA